ncbi:Uncharacterised protein [Streptococcus pneumoniae]|nr:Uncharacterised protein [Streptococcus pneumoniae]CIZ34751.1 Uncharacterised protein [Streptococcus pneumoniae]VJL27842.1 Uncharacterised protein [Streptococcus pneumoniae]VKB49321.1 Uncharacterised protein [Streptococcus pneumoniae]VKQ23667.1 Uncharacterised protein [Streptococcus pneumoniae]
MEGKSLEDLSKRQIEVLTRINNEPLSILPNSDDGLLDYRNRTIAQGAESSGALIFSVVQKSPPTALQEVRKNSPSTNRGCTHT